MSAAPPNPNPAPSSFSSHPATGISSSSSARHHHYQQHQTTSLTTPISTPALDVSNATATAIPSSYHHSSYATCPSSTPTPTQHHPQSQSYTPGIQISSSSSSLVHMARLQSHFSQLAPSCSAHLADQNAIPILSTTPHAGAAGISNLSAAFVQAHDTACRLGLGVPLRVTVTTGAGAAVIQSGVLPEKGEEEECVAHGNGNGVRSAGVGGEGVMLVGTVVAPGDRLAEARIASWGVEEVAKKFQRFMCEGK